MKEILLIHLKSFSHTQLKVFNQLQKWFPEYTVVTFDVNLVHKRFRFYFMLNIFYFIHEYGIDFLLGNKKLKHIRTYFYSTRLILAITNKKIRNFVKYRNFKFIFQLQTLFNGRVPGIPHYVYTDHITIANNTYPDINSKEYIRSRFFVAMEQSLCQNSTLCFTWSTNISRLMIKEYKINSEKVRCIKVGSNVVNNCNEEEGNSKYNSKTILFVGLDWKRKGGPTLIAAFRRVLEVIPDALLVIVGCSPDISLRNVKVLGKIPLDQIPEFYRNASVFCVPTLREPFGIVFIEAMHYKLPVVSNNIGALPDIVVNGFNGFLISKNSDEELAKILITLLENPSMCEKMGKTGYDFVNQNYNWDKVGELIHENIQSTLIG